MNVWLNVGAKEIPIRLLGADIEEYSIVVRDVSGGIESLCVDAAAHNAAKQLQKYISLISGTVLPIVKSGNPLVKDREILIGNTERFLQEADILPLGDEGYRLLTRENKLCIIGSGRGLLYGVFSFLEKYCGVRFFSPCVEKIRGCKMIKIENIDVAYAPLAERDFNRSQARQEEETRQQERKSNFRLSQ